MRVARAVRRKKALPNILEQLRLGETHDADLALHPGEGQHERSIVGRHPAFDRESGGRENSLQRRTIILVAQLGSDTLALLEAGLANLWNHNLERLACDKMHLDAVLATTIECAVLEFAEWKIRA